MVARQALCGALDVLGSDAYAAGWRSSAAERGVETERAATAERWATLAVESWNLELEFFAGTGEVVVDGDLAVMRDAVARFAAARRAWGAAAERHAAGSASSAELEQARSAAAAAGRGIEYRVLEPLTEGAEPPVWPRPASELLVPGGPFGVYAAADSELDRRVSERLAGLVLDKGTRDDAWAWCAAIEALIAESRDGIAAECGPAGVLAEPSRAWWLRRLSEVARGWRGVLWGPIPYGYVRAPVDDLDWLRPETSEEW